MTEENNAAKIRALNDEFRKTRNGGTVMLTRGIIDLLDTLRSGYAEHFIDEYLAVPEEFLDGGMDFLMKTIAEFDKFSEDNDPWCEHDFAAMDFHGTKIFWKIDYYSAERRAENRFSRGSENPADAAATHRVLTVMLASEY